MSQVTKRECKKRPTFTEVRKYLPTKIQNDQLKEIIVDLKARDKDKSKKKAKVLVDTKNPSFKNADYDESKLPNITTETFVANKYVERMYSQMSND